MRVTQRFWLAVTVGLVVLGWAVVVGSPLLVVAGAGLGGWLLARQLRFVRALAATDEALEVDQFVDSGRLTAGGDTLVTVSASLSVPASLTVDVEPSLPVGVQEAPERMRLDGEAVASFETTWPVAGKFSVPKVTVEYSDPYGLFEQSVERGPTPTVFVEPRAPRNVHVGEGGDAIATGFGEHDAGELGGGLEPAELRQYVPGDAYRHIDWKATARLDEPHVREFESETDRETLLFVDHRVSLGDGPAGERKLDFARQLALAFVESAGELGDPLGCYTVGDGGVTATFRPTASDETLNAIRRHLLDLSPTEAAGDAGEATSPARARQLVYALSEDDSEFSRTLTPYFEDQETYVERIETRPLFRALKTYRNRRSGTVWSVIVTDDTNRTELREAVKVARRGGGRVAVFLTPSVLFSEASLADAAAAYDEYRSFEEFRRSLSRQDRVSAFEVGPKDALAAVLAGNRSPHKRRASR